VAAASLSLSELIEKDERARALLGADDPLPGPQGYLDVLRSARAAGGMPELRRTRRLELLRIAQRDLSGDEELESVTRALSDLAAACVQVTLEDIGASQALGVIGMGKLGGRELNYVSDIDVMFVTDGDLTEATRAAEGLLRTLGEHSAEGRAYQIDAALRPEGRAGALVRSLDGYLEYYRRWAQPWEYQALIKARAVAGNAAMGERLVEETRAFVYPQEITSEHIASIREMKRRVEENAVRVARKSKASEIDDVKLGPGGIRDIEFSVQLLQLVHGGSDPAVRATATLGALKALVEGGYVADEDGAGLAVAYRWHRTVEHRLQLWQERRVHVLPSDDDGRSRLARSLGFRDSPGASAAERFNQRHSAVLADVRGRFEKLFYRPMVESLADAGATRMSSEALQERLAVLGFRDVERAARTLEGLVAGTSRRAKLLRVLTPAMLRFLQSTPLPDEGLLSFLRLGEVLSGRIDTLGALRDNPPGIEFLAKVLGSGRFLGEMLGHVPEELQTIADPRGLGEPKERSRVVREAVASLGWREPEKRLDGLRRFKRRELLGIALADLAGRIDVGTVGEALADLADACLDAALEAPPVPFAVLGMGKLGGRELNYSSDIDVMFVHDGDPEIAEKVAEDLMAAVGGVTPEGQAFRIDAGLRPEGKSGPLARSVQSFIEYYERWSRPWERMALIKARVAAGDPGLGEEVVARLREHAFPTSLEERAIAEIRHLKARMERERVPGGTDPRRHLKMGPGGLADIEFAVQILQLMHGGGSDEMRAGSTLEALDAAGRAGAVPEDDARRLADGYRFLMRLRNRLFFMFGRPVDALPAKPEDLEALGIAIGYTEQPRQELEEEYLRVTRRVRRISEPLISG
jgi:glutamate-ammonia-ligase adenylyltransferase